MTLTRRILKAIYPKHEQERMEFRMAVARAMAEAEDVARTCFPFDDRRDTKMALKKKVNGVLKDV